MVSPLTGPHPRECDEPQSRATNSSQSLSRSKQLTCCLVSPTRHSHSSAPAERSGDGALVDGIFPRLVTCSKNYFVMLESKAPSPLRSAGALQVRTFQSKSTHRSR